MKIFNKVVMLALMAISVIALNMKAQANPVSASGDYGLSCTNLAYGTQHGGVYISNGNISSTSEAVGGGYGVYVGLNCAYSGGGRTNSSAIVGGEIARAAANAVIGAVSNRLATAMSMSNDTAAHMSYSTNEHGIGMAANHIVGGMSIWTNYTSSDFENTQTFTNVQLDSNNYEASSNAMTIGVDKKFGNVIVGLAYTGFDSDIDTSVNEGNIETEGETLGVYIGLNTGPINLSVGGGTGEYEINTTRKDMGSRTDITATDITADVTYYHVNLSGTVSRGKLNISPRVAYRNFDLDLPAFTDIVPNDSNTFISTTSTSGDEQDAADENVAGKTYSSDMTEAGISVSLNTGAKLIPFVDFSYVGQTQKYLFRRVKRRRHLFRSTK